MQTRPAKIQANECVKREEIGMILFKNCARRVPKMVVGLMKPSTSETAEEIE
jgi:hypothetical protein